MRIAEYIDTHEMKEELSSWFTESKEEVIEMLTEEERRVNREKRRDVDMR